MNFRLLLLSSALAATAALTSCDIIKGPKKDYDQLQSNTSQKLLLEDFTGHTCGNCPAAHRAAADLVDVYGDKLIVVAVHAGGFAVPKPTLGYPADFRTAMGEELENNWNVDGAGFPKGMINRRTYGGNTLLNFSSWGGYISSVLAEEPKVGIDLAATFNESSRVVDLTADIEYYEGAVGNHNLVVIVTEDSVVSRQTDYSVTPSDVDGYYQRHMLRGSITDGTWGNTLTTGSTPVGATFNRDFTYTLDSTWDWHHCSIVAYVMDAESKEVFQVEEVHLHE
jgi:thiol-disulfide isomerase/thioredoxin